MSPLIIRLLTIMNNEKTTSTYYHIAQLLLKHYPQIAELSIAEIADLCHVSKSTISKFARFIGFEDYTELKAAIPFTEKENKYYFDLNYIANIIQPIEQDGYEPYFDAVIKDIVVLKKELNLSVIDCLAKDLLRYEKIGAFGLLFSESAAIDFQYKLAYTGKYIVTFQNDVKQTKFIEEADEDTLIIVFSNSGGFIQRQQLRKNISYKSIFEKCRAKIYVITANESVNNYPFIDEVILFPHATHFQTHAFIYQIIMDLIVSRYLALSKKVVSD